MSANCDIKSNKVMQIANAFRNSEQPIFKIELIMNQGNTFRFFKNPHLFGIMTISSYAY